MIKDKEGSPIGYTFIAKNVPIIELADEPNPVLSVAPNATISAELAHRRLGHAGSYKGRINKDKLGCDVGTEHYDCEPCGKGKSKRIVSRDQQARATRVGQLLHVDLHPVKPKDLNSKTGKVEIEYMTGKPTERTRQANFDAVASSAIATASAMDRTYDFGGMAIAASAFQNPEQ
ncbi:hypothetical protein N7516_008503 [Penicillium verrucosum]|uniref:uncharacterized protein n=1 Tax=Penicillium verrucosum TaxID=60171 RepID=UPI002544F6DF|nr:uncharacterized protein N7516_008503 [Penicillium verrucosum]KAJ5926730.1 hypothetical protein N7516_008503 [Penicillium verrucosum]